MTRQNEDVLWLVGLFGLAAAMALLVSGCKLPAGLEKLVGNGDAEINNAGTIAVQNVHVEGQNNRGQIDQSEREEVAR